MDNYVAFDSYEFWLFVCVLCFRRLVNALLSFLSFEFLIYIRKQGVGPRPNRPFLDRKCLFISCARRFFIRLFLCVGESVVIWFFCGGKIKVIIITV